MMELKIREMDLTARKSLPDGVALGFGRAFTDHMFLWNYQVDRGWFDARIEPRHSLSLDPAAMVLHYSQQVFEGLKAFRGRDDGMIRLFRHRQHLQRMRRSAAMLCMPDFNADELEEAVKALITVDAHWVPESPGCSLYIRPVMIAVDPFLGVRPADEYLLYVILSPVGAYYPKGFEPIGIMVQDKYVRAFEGGVGAAKTGGNYAASLRAQQEAKEAGLTQVLWLDGKEHRYVEEVGTMNIFFARGNEVVTSPLSDSIIPGVTRDAVVSVIRGWPDYQVSERKIPIDELLADIEKGVVTEVFGTGTAAIISPVGHLVFRGKRYAVGSGGAGPLAQRLYDHILGVQYGVVEDALNWMTIV